MNAWSAISVDTEPAARRLLWLGGRRLRLLVSGAGAIGAFTALAIADASAPRSAVRIAPPQAVQPVELAATRTEQPVAVDGRHSSAEPETIRITGTVGPDLTSSLQAAGVPERQGREYVAILARAIQLHDGLSVADRFDLVIVREEGGVGELAYAGLDRIGRSDLELMKGTDGKEVRWIDADRLDPSAEGMQMPVAGRVSSPFGERFHPVLHYRKMHNGVDLAARHGAAIVAAASGRVVSAGWHGGYGRQVAIEHADGVRTTYSHMSKFAAVPGSNVRQGQVIGYVGSTGLSTGPHLHYEVYRNGSLVNPLTVKLTQSPLQGEELHAFRSRLRGLLTARR